MRQGNYKWFGPEILRSQYSNQFIFEFFYKRLVISWWTQKQMTPEEERRQEEIEWNQWREYKDSQQMEIDVREKWEKVRADIEKARQTDQDISA